MTNFDMILILYAIFVLVVMTYIAYRGNKK